MKCTENKIYNALIQLPSQSFCYLIPHFLDRFDFVFTGLKRSLHRITGAPEGTWCNAVERNLGKLRSNLDYLMIDEVIDTGLHQFLDALQERINNVDDCIFKMFFDLKPLDMINGD